jgi:RNA polymerase sigma-70 factor (ECF subfamily)
MTLEITSNSPENLSLNITQEDEVLAIRASRDPNAFAELYRRHFQQIYRYHMAHTGNVADSQDLTTQTFLAALEGIERYQRFGSFCAWLMGIARRKIAMHYRSIKPEEPLELIADLPDNNPLPESIVGQRLDISSVCHALRNLTPEQAEAIILCIYANLSDSEAGRVMGKSEAAVKMLILRGMRDLKQKLAVVTQEEK